MIKRSWRTGWTFSSYAAISCTASLHMLAYYFVQTICGSRTTDCRNSSIQSAPPIVIWSEITIERCMMSPGHLVSRNTSVWLLFCGLRLFMPTRIIFSGECTYKLKILLSIQPPLWHSDVSVEHDWSSKMAHSNIYVTKNMFWNMNVTLSTHGTDNEAWHWQSLFASPPVQVSYKSCLWLLNNHHHSHESPILEYFVMGIRKYKKYVSSTLTSSTGSHRSSQMVTFVDRIRGLSR
jgi:hypothetical protein